MTLTLLFTFKPMRYFFYGLHLHLGPAHTALGALAQHQSCDPAREVQVVGPTNQNYDLAHNRQRVLAQQKRHLSAETPAFLVLSWGPLLTQGCYI